MQDFRMKTFLTVCRFMNYTKAAKALNLTQPAVSQHIRYLENIYGVLLFEKSGKRIHLTEAGKILYEASLTMQHDEQHMKLRMQQTRVGVQNYSFGATLTVAEFMLIDDLKRFIEDQPNSRVHMQVENTRELLKKLDASEIDFAIVEGDFPQDQYDYLPYKQEEYVAVASRKKAEQYAGASISDLLGERLFLREPGSGTREILERRLLEQGIRLHQFHTVIELASIGAINSMLASHMGISFCYRAAISREDAMGNLAPISLCDLSLQHDIMFIFRKGSIFKEDYLEIYHKLCRKP